LDESSHDIHGLKRNDQVARWRRWNRWW